MSNTLPIQQVAPDFCVAPQLAPAAMAEAAAAGFRSVVNNRPDFEHGPDQTTSAASSLKRSLRVPNSTRESTNPRILRPTRASALACVRLLTTMRCGCCAISEPSAPAAAPPAPSSSTSPTRSSRACSKGSSTQTSPGVGMSRVA